MKNPHAHLDPVGLKVVGSTNLPVKVYVKTGHNGPRILCLTNHLRNLELIDPIFQWHGPGGDLVTENQTVKISPTGTLLFRHFRDDMSGVYTCSLVFKPTAEQAEKSYLIKYIVYAYSDPTSYYEVSARYHAAPCNSIYNTSFVKKMLQALGQVIARLSCEITLRKSECHRVKMQRAGLQNQIFLTFMGEYFVTVSYLDAEKSSRNTCTKNACDVTRRLRKVE
ncbi:hypothetical protein lerEdw1_001896 [Lerista edwardsae]|nr:hypothetical protein lerEdw1_001896 [Lerista edwardsae]